MIVLTHGFCAGTSTGVGNRLPGCAGRVGWIGCTVGCDTMIAVA